MNNFSFNNFYNFSVVNGSWRLLCFPTANL